MHCIYCKENQAVKTYERIKNNKKTVEAYCLHCYEQLFLSEETAGIDDSAHTCPYCGMTLAEFESKKLVGCAYCYTMMRGGVLPMIIKMQGKEVHKGKTPSLDSFEEQTLERLGRTTLTEEEYQAALERSRLRRQCEELEIIIAKLTEEENFEGAQGYADKLSRMRGNARIEEEFVWRKLFD